MSLHGGTKTSIKFRVKSPEGDSDFVALVRFLVYVGTTKSYWPIGRQPASEENVCWSNEGVKVNMPFAI